MVIVSGTGTYNREYHNLCSCLVVHTQSTWKRPQSFCVDISLIGISSDCLFPASLNIIKFEYYKWNANSASGAMLYKQLNAPLSKYPSLSLSLSPSLVLCLSLSLSPDRALRQKKKAVKPKPKLPSHNSPSPPAAAKPTIQHERYEQVQPTRKTRGFDKCLRTLQARFSKEIFTPYDKDGALFVQCCSHSYLTHKIKFTS